MLLWHSLAGAFPPRNYLAIRELYTNGHLNKIILGPAGISSHQRAARQKKCYPGTFKDAPQCSYFLIFFKNKHALVGKN